MSIQGPPPPAPRVPEGAPYPAVSITRCIDPEDYAPAFNDGYNTAMAHQLMSNEEIENKSADEWLAEKISAVLEASHRAGAALRQGARTPRTITTTEELEALAIGSVVISDKYISRDGYPCSFQRLHDGDWNRGGRLGDTHPDYILPAMVLWEPIP